MLYKIVVGGIMIVISGGVIGSAVASQNGAIGLIGYLLAVAGGILAGCWLKEFAS